MAARTKGSRGPRKPGFWAGVGRAFAGAFRAADKVADRLVNPKMTQVRHGKAEWDAETRERVIPAQRTAAGRRTSTRWTARDTVLYEYRVLFEDGGLATVRTFDRSDAEVRREAAKEWRRVYGYDERAETPGVSEYRLTGCSSTDDEEE